MQIYGQKKREGNRKKKVWPVLRFEPSTAYMWNMYDNQYAIEDIINKCRFFVNLDMYLCVNKLHDVHDYIQ